MGSRRSSAKARHPFSVRHPGDHLLDGGRDVHGRREAESAIANQMNGRRGGAVLRQKALQPGADLRLSVHLKAVYTRVASTGEKPRTGRGEYTGGARADFCSHLLLVLLTVWSKNKHDERARTARDSLKSDQQQGHGRADYVDPESELCSRAPFRRLSHHHERRPKAPRRPLCSPWAVFQNRTLIAS